MRKVLKCNGSVWIFFSFARGGTYIAEQSVRHCSMHAAENIMYRTPSVLQFTCEVPELQRRANWTNRVEQKDSRTARKLAWLVKCPLNKTRLRLGWPRQVATCRSSQMPIFGVWLVHVLGPRPKVRRGIFFIPCYHSSLVWDWDGTEHWARGHGEGGKVEEAFFEAKD